MGKEGMDGDVNELILWLMAYTPPPHSTHPTVSIVGEIAEISVRQRNLWCNFRHRDRLVETTTLSLSPFHQRDLEATVSGAAQGAQNFRFSFGLSL